METKLYPSKIEYNTSSYLGISTGPVARKYFFGKLSEFKKYPGWVVKDGEIREWNIEGLCDLEENTYFYGQFIEGQVWDAFYDTKPENWQDLLLKLLKAYQLVCEKIEGEFILYSTSVLCLKEGGFLFLPPQLMSEIIILSSSNVQMEQRQLLNHPDLHGNESVAYFAGIFAYKQLTGELPYSSGVEDEVKFQIRNRKLLPLEYRLPGLRKQVSDFIQNALNQSSSSLPSISTWISELCTWQKEGLYREISAQEIQVLTEKGVLHTKILEKKYQTTHFLHKHRSKIITITLVSSILLFIVGSSLYNIFLRPRSTVDLSPPELVEAFYTGITAVDFIMVEDCVLKGVAKAEVNEVMNLFVMSRQQLAMTNAEPIYPADKWLEDGRPATVPGRQIFGIAKLKVQEVGTTEEPVFTAEYEKWYSQVIGDELVTDKPEIAYTGQANLDHLYLKKDRGGWIIYRLERIKSQELTYKPGEENDT